MFIDLKVNVTDSLKRVDIDWVFDEMNSEILLMDYDMNGDDSFSKSEIENFKNSFFIEFIEEYNSFTYVTVDELTEIESKYLFENIGLSVSKDRNFIISFSLNLRGIAIDKELWLKFYDSSHMTAFELQKKNLKSSKKYLLDESGLYYGYELKVYK
jgi:ABC-type uncharacterized transport system substrate-binding protein